MKHIACGTWSAIVAEECGGNLISLCCDGYEILRKPASLEQLQQRPCLYGIPLLLPANRIKDGTFSFEGRQYEMPINEVGLNNHIHGLIKNVPFTVVSHSEDAVVTSLENHGEFYPFPFRVEIEDRLDENGYCRSLTLKNIGTRNMPYTIAYHTTFVTPDKFAVALDKFCELGEGYIPTGRELDLSPEQQTYRDGLVLEGKKINGLYTSGGNVARIGDYKMVVSEQFDHWIIFNGNGDEGYLCIEPQRGSTNGLNSGEHAVLAPGRQETFVIRIEKW